MKTILVVEDTEDLRELFIEVLRDEGYQALGAEHGQQALEILQSLAEEPSLVLLDLMMPVMDGKTFLSTLHASRPESSLPIVVVSAMASESELAGVKKIIKKPVSPRTLTDVVLDVCGPP